MFKKQSGFSEERGCVDQIITLRMFVEKYLDKGKKLCEAFIDLENAYGRVDRRHL